MKNENIKSSAVMKLLCVRVLVWCILFFERIWLRLLPFFLILSFFCSLSWFGIFGILNYWLHLFLLWLMLFFAVGSLFFLLRFRLPTIKDVHHRIEQINGLKNQPLSVQTDHLCPENDEGLNVIIWREHQRRMAEQLSHLKTGFAHPNSAACDPLALRTLCILLCVCAFSFSFGSLGGRLADAFDLRPVVDEASIRIDAWVTPPIYTGVAPIYLTQGETTQFTVPEGSNMVIRVVNGAGVTVKAISEEDAREVSLSQKSEKTALNDPIIHFETLLERSISLLVSSRHKQQQWHLHVIKDQIPTIHWLGKPERVLAGSLELQYEMDDDYGVTKAFVEIEPLLGQQKNTASLYKAPEIKLLLARGGKGKMRTVQDVSSHPWAGSEVKVTLVAEDGAGQQGRSKTFGMILPQRIFSDPVARAASELRRLLALNASAQEHVLDMLAALLVRPEDGLQNATHFLVLQSAWTRLSLAKTEDELRDVVDYLWQIALGIEGNQNESVQKNLKQAQAALRDALRNGASATEIERLMANLRQAMDDYIRALAKTAQDKSSLHSPNLSEDTLQKKLNLIEEMAKMGSSFAAEQLLAEVEKILDHLQVHKGNQDKGENNSQTAQMKKELDKLSDLMRRQQEILNETYQLEMEQRRGESVPKKRSESLQKRQAELHSRLSELGKGLSKQGFEQGDALKKAEENMNSAEIALDDGNYRMSKQNQLDALESLRQGAQNVLKKMREVLEKAGNKKNSTSGPKDPLGRPLSSKTDQGQEQGQEDVVVPQESDQMRARQILEEIRKRLGKEHIPETEKNYLERLLHFN
ncbi:TIGR02302 family protein [Bartonella sp. CB60]|uniref:TIGR02302 family protein n=1 Tax=Bartonella sp. CB60 TaxID=3113619 RepID=UPI00300DDB23